MGVGGQEEAMDRGGGIGKRWNGSGINCHLAESCCIFASLTSPQRIQGEEVSDRGRKCRPMTHV